MTSVHADITENLIWHEFALAFCYNKKIRYYTDRHRKLNRVSNWIVILLTTASSITFWSSNGYAILAAILATIAALATILKELLPIFQQSDDELIELDKIASFYAKYQVEMERLFISIKYGNQHPAFCENEFFRLKSKSSEYLIITNRYFRGIPKRIDNKINKELDLYANEVFNNQDC